ncbi:unnamed protein product [Dicrocoelium dendriticum]|nr:unnamed protein product [Dicrocoelium dendriticum]
MECTSIPLIKSLLLLSRKYDQLLAKFEEMVSTKVTTVGVSIADCATQSSPLSADPIPRRTATNTESNTTRRAQNNNCCSNTMRGSRLTNAVPSSIAVTTRKATSNLPKEYVENLQAGTSESWVTVTSVRLVKTSPRRCAKLSADIRRQSESETADCTGTPSVSASTP